MPRLSPAAIAVLMGFLATATGLGVSRQSYPLILPAMRDGLDLTYVQAGLLQTANLFGYMFVSWPVGRLVPRFGPRLVMSGGVLLCGVSLVATSFVNSFEMGIVTRFINGAGTVTMVVGYVPLIAGWFSPARRGRVLGLVNGGSGAGLALSGFIAPALLGTDDDWRAAWLGLGILTTAVGLVALVIVRDVKRDPAAAIRERDPHAWRYLLPVAIVYTLYGMANGVYTTFFGAMLLSRLGEDANPGRYWALIGMLALAGPFVWGWVSDRLGSRAGMLIVLALVVLACSLVPFTSSPLGVQASVVTFGITYASVPSLISVLLSHLAGPRYVGAAVGTVSVGSSFGLGIGPAIAGTMVADGGFGLAYGFAAGLAALSFAFFLLFRVRTKRPTGS